MSGKQQQQRLLLQQEALLELQVLLLLGFQGCPHFQQVFQDYQAWLSQEDCLECLGFQACRVDCQVFLSCPACQVVCLACQVCRCQVSEVPCRPSEEQEGRQGCQAYRSSQACQTFLHCPRRQACLIFQLSWRRWEWPRRLGLP